MKEVLQTKFGGPGCLDGEHGNCYAACVASVFELPLDELPDPRPDDDSSDAIWDEWFRERGLASVTLIPREGMSPPSGYTIGTVHSAFGDHDHAVVCLDGEIVWDPRPEQNSYGSKVKSYDVFVVLDPAKGAAAHAEDLPCQ